MQMNLSSRQLRAFAALARERNFTRAAAECHLSQPAFSALIRQLEQSVGLHLFDRSTRFVDLSAEGRSFEHSATRILEEIDAALAAASERAAGRRGRVSIALLPSLAAGWLPRILAGFRAGHPGVEIEVADVLSEPCVAAVRSGHADFALAATHADTPELQATRFCSDRFHLVCPVGHPLLGRRSVRPPDLVAWPFIHLSRSTSVRQFLDAATHPRPIPAVLEVDQLATVSGMVRAGLGVSIVPALTLYQFASPELATRPLHWPGLERVIYLLRRKDRALPVASRTFCDWVMAHPPSQARRRGTGS